MLTICANRTSSLLFRFNRRSFTKLAHESSPAALRGDDDQEFLPQMPPFDYTPPPYDGPSAAELLEKRQRHLNPCMSYFYKNPMGRCNTYSMRRDADISMLLEVLQQASADFAEALASKCPGDLNVVFFTNSGTEANELALMISRLYTGFHDIISVRNGYHGNAGVTMSATGQCNYKYNVVQSGIHHALNPDPYRGIFGSDGPKYAKDVDEIITYGTCGRVAGFIAEAIQGVGGIYELAPGYLQAVYNSVRKGFARTGSHFWGFEAQGVVPDIITMAKGIGNGLPLGAVVTTSEIAKVLTCHGYLNTFGGNPVSTAGGLAVLKVIEKEKLQQNALKTGTYLKNQLLALKEKHQIIGDVRGRGFLLGMELVTDRELKTPATRETLYVMEQMKDMGVLIGKGGLNGNIFRISPPLCFTREDADFLVSTMDHIISKM
ncbi:unnamed protein product [Lactuca virosa]|uniref:Uncharacterized protein n=1 Tax=Lactuca virosa TaxID=75947 RepID=A0AAU9NDS3_9ASTR|nr:unnamed protein product [Lactuca virosa]